MNNAVRDELTHQRPGVLAGKLDPVALRCEAHRCLDARPVQQDRRVAKTHRSEPFSLTQCPVDLHWIRRPKRLGRRRSAGWWWRDHNQAPSRLMLNFLGDGTKPVTVRLRRSTCYLDQYRVVLASRHNVRRILPGKVRQFVCRGCNDDLIPPGPVVLGHTFEFCALGGPVWLSHRNLKSPSVEARVTLMCRKSAGAPSKKCVISMLILSSTGGTASPQPALAAALTVALQGGRRSWRRRVCCDTGGPSTMKSKGSKGV